jgi:hypothetical protein
MQDDTLRRKFLLDRTRHVWSPFDVPAPDRSDRVGLFSRIAPPLASDHRWPVKAAGRRRRRGDRSKKHRRSAADSAIFRDAALVVAQYPGH